jgi:hypothetical protein
VTLLRPHARRQCDGIDFAEEPVKRARQRVLLLSLRHTFLGGCGRRVVLSPVPFLIWFTGGCGVTFIASGFWYGRIARKQNP